MGCYNKWYMGFWVPKQVRGVSNLKIVLFEDDKKRRWKMSVIIRQTRSGAEVIPFEKPEAVLQYVEENRPEIAFISAENADGRGYFLIKKIRQLSPQTNIIAVAREYRFAQEMLKLRVSGYVTGKFTVKKVIDELQNLRFQCEESSQA